jgi:predicted nucleic acid-binding protein
VKFVIDASVALKWFLADEANEIHVDKAFEVLNKILNGGCEIAQPPHWRAEVLAVMARRKPSAAPDILRVLYDLIEDHGIEGHGDEDGTAFDIYVEAAALAARLNQHVFDTLYHAVARQTGATLITADERYFRAAIGEGSIQLLKDFNVT